MNAQDRAGTAGHLTDEELFALALPAVGEPEALPAHLLDCRRCGRALQEWKTAARELAAEDVEPVMRRSSAEWRDAEDRTMEAIRRAGPRHSRALPWAVGLAASVVLAALLLPARRPAPAAPAGPQSASAASELSAQDKADDTLLREVSALSRGEDRGDWSGLAPDPVSPGEGSL